MSALNTSPRVIRSKGRWRGLMGDRPPLFFMGVLVVLVIVAILAPWLTPYGPNEFVLTSRMLPPAFMEGGTLAHPLGTDTLGRDILTLLVYGSRVSLIVGQIGRASCRERVEGEGGEVGLKDREV